MTKVNSDAIWPSPATEGRNGLVRNDEKSAVPKPDPSDELLLAELIAGNQEALGTLFRRYGRMVRSVALRILRDHSEADDLVQEAFLFVHRKCALFNPSRGSLRSWLVQVTYHRAIDRRRKLKSRHFYDGVELDEALLVVSAYAPDPAPFDESVEHVLGKQMLKRLGSALSVDQRRTIELYFFEGYSFEEIASAIGHSVGNVRNHYYRALEKMRRLIPAKLRPK